MLTCDWHRTADVTCMRIFQLSSTHIQQMRCPRSPDTYTHYAQQDGVHAMFTGEISEWPGIDMMSEQHDGE